MDESDRREFQRRVTQIAPANRREKKRKLAQSLGFPIRAGFPNYTLMKFECRFLAS